MTLASLDPSTWRCYPNRPIRFGTDHEYAAIIGSSEQTMTLWDVEPANNLGKVTVVHIANILDDVLDEFIDAKLTGAMSQISSDDAASVAEGDLKAAEGELKRMMASNERNRLLLDTGR